MATREPLQVSLSLEERAALQRIADRDGVSLAQAARTLILHESDRSDALVNGKIRAT